MRPHTAVIFQSYAAPAQFSAFPGMTAKGDVLFGLPAITSRNTPESESPHIDTSITLVDPSQVLLADDNEGGVRCGAEHASVQMADAPGSGAQQLVSLWQVNAVALRAEGVVNWLPRRAGMAQVLDEVDY